MATSRTTTNSQLNARQAISWCKQYVERFGFLNVISGQPISWDVSIDVVTTASASLTASGKQSPGDGLGARDDFSKAPAAVTYQRDRLIDGLLRPNASARRRLAICGQGGAGKSEYMRHIAYRLARHCLENPRDGHALVPVHVQLRELDPDVRTGGSADRLFKRHLVPNGTDWIAAYAKAGRVAFILDGFDELQLQRESFGRALAALIHKYGTCAFVVAGRVGSIPLRRLGFDKENEHQLRPLTDGEMRAYADKYFLSCGSPGRAQEFWNELESQSSSLSSLVETPFMLALAVDYFQRNIGQPRRFPDNPGTLIESQLRRLFRERARTTQLPGDNICFQGLSTLAAFALVDPDHEHNRHRIQFGRMEAMEWLVTNSARISYFDGKIDLHRTADDLIDKLAPASGVLTQSNDLVGFTNKVIQEFLAARWMAEYGYPMWPYRTKGRYYVDRAIVLDSRERQLYDFFGDHAWSYDYSALMSALAYQLGRPDPTTENDHEGTRRSGNVNLLICCAAWHAAAADVFYPRTGSTHPNCLAILIQRMAAFFRALPNNLTDSQMASVISIAHRIVPPDTDWFDDIMQRKWVESLPRSCRGSYLTRLYVLLDMVQGLPHNRWRVFVEFAQILPDDFPRKSAAMTLALRAVTQALAAVASGNPHENWNEIRDLAYAVASNFADNRVAMRRASEMLNRTLAVISEEPTPSWGDIHLFAEEICVRFPDDRAAMKRSWEQLASVLTATSLDVIPRRRDIVFHWYGQAVASGFARRPTWTKRATELLARCMDEVSQDPSGRWRSIMYLANAIVAGFSGQAQAQEQAQGALTRALEVASRDPEANWKAIHSLANAIASGFSRDEAAMRKALVALKRALVAVGGDPTDDWSAARDLAGAIASGFADDKVAMRQAAVALTRALVTAIRDPKENWKAIHLLATTVSKAFADEKSTMRRALGGLTSALAAVRRLGKCELFTIYQLAGAITEGFKANKVAMAQAMDALKWALSEVSANPEDNASMMTTLAGVVASAFPDDLNAAALVMLAGKTVNKDIFYSREVLTLWAVSTRDGVSYSKDWDLAEAPIIRSVDDPDNRTQPQALIVAPREKIRRGLPASLLSKILAELARAQPEANDLLGSIPAISSSSVGAISNAPITTETNAPEASFGSSQARTEPCNGVAEADPAGQRQQADPVLSPKKQRICRIGVDMRRKEILVDSKVVMRGSGQLCYIFQRLIDADGGTVEAEILCPDNGRNFRTEPSQRASAALANADPILQELFEGLPGAGGRWLKPEAFWDC